MSFEPIFNAPFPIQIHAGCALIALFLGPFVILRNKRDRLHKMMGYIWVMVMAITAVSSFWIVKFQLIGPFSPIHGLSCFVLYSLYRGVSHAIARNITAHRQTFRALYVWSLVLAGLFTLLPGRTMNKVLFGDMPQLGMVVLIAGLAVIGWVYLGRRWLRGKQAI